MIPEFNIVIAAIKADFSGLEGSAAWFEENETDKFSSEFNIQFNTKFNTQRLFELAHHHGCVWEVFSYCKLHGLLNENEVEDARLLVMQATAHAMRHEKQLVDLLHVFDDSNISYALLKGAAIYPQFRTASEQGSRQSADIDVLVNPEDVLKVVKVLLDRDFDCDDSDTPLRTAEFVHKHQRWVKHRDMSFSLPEQFINIDLHWQVAYPFSLPMITSDLLTRTEFVDVQSRPVACLSFDDHFILLCIHGYLDRFFILKHLVDIHWATHHPRFNLENISRLAKKYGVEEQVQSACATADLFFNQLDKQSRSYKNYNKVHKQYAQSTSHRYEEHEGTPPRMHPGRQKWRLKDKIAYIKHQMNTRSERAWLLAPILHRLKYDDVMIDAKPQELTAWLWWPFGYAMKVIKKCYSQVRS